MTVTPATARALREAGRRLAGQLERRDELVRQAAAEGGSLREIGELVGLSHTAVRYIVHGRPSASSAEEENDDG